MDKIINNNFLLAQYLYWVTNDYDIEALNKIITLIRNENPLTLNN